MNQRFFFCLLGLLGSSVPSYPLLPSWVLDSILVRADDDTRYRAVVEPKPVVDIGSKAGDRVYRRPA